MNTFNAFQAVGFYSCLPVLINWLYTNGHETWSYIAGVVMFVGYCILSICIADWK